MTLFFRRRYVSCLILPLALLCLIRPAAAAAEWTDIEDVNETGGYDVAATVQQLPATLLLAGQPNGDGYRLKLTPARVELQVQQGPAPTVLAGRAEKVAPGPLVVQRRGPLWRVVMNHRVLLQAEDARWHAGKMAYRGQLSDTRVQPVEEVFFDDDFMRIKSEVAMAEARADPHHGVRIKDVKVEETIWKVLRGSWATTGLSESEAAQVSQSANPFAYKSGNVGPNLAVAGRPFWSDYSAEVSVKPLGAAAVGLGVYAQDASNYLMLLWQASGHLQLRSVVDGKVTVLDEAPGSYQDTQWYRLRLTANDGLLRGFVDDAEVLRAPTGWFGRGQVALYTENPVSTASAVFDDVAVRGLRDLREDFSAVVPGRWDTIAGHWKMQGAAAPVGAAGAYAVTGENSWSGYSAAATINLPRDGSAGVLLHHQSGNGAYLLRLNGPGAAGSARGKAQLLKLVAGKTSMLGEATMPAYTAAPQRWVLTFDRGYLRGSNEQGRVVDAFDTATLTAGRAGIFAQRGASGVAPTITSFEADFTHPATPWAKVPELYELEMQAETMGGWSTPQGFWVAAPNATTTSGSGKTYWHKGTFFGDASVRFKLPNIDKEDLHLMLDEATAAKPRELRFHSANGQIEVALLVSGKEVKHGSAGAPSALPGQLVEVASRGNYIVVWMGPEEKQVPLLVADLK